jgi:DNA (cytosine-5)-methyltransferase 1
MDTPKTVTHVSLCAGYGGIDLGLKRAVPGLRTIAFSEIEAFACANLVAKMEAGQLDPAPIWTNVKTFPWEQFRGKVDILSGGYPCQPFSAAGKRLGKNDPRHLWPWIADGIRICQPGMCFFENVEGHITLGLREVIGELEESGYRTTWGIFSASEVGAPHQRKRIFVLAHRIGERGLLPHQWNESGEQLPIRDGEARRTWPSRPGQPQHEWEPPRVVGNTTQLQRDGGDHNGKDSKRSEAVSESRNTSWQSVGDTEGQRGGKGGNPLGTGEGFGPAWPNRGVDQWGQTEPTLGRDADGVAGGVDYAELCVSCDNRTDELRLLGNGVVPATAEHAFRTLIARFLSQ